MAEEDEYPTAAEQYGFSDTHIVIKKLVKDGGFDPILVAEGILTAAIYCFSLRLSYEEIAKILYNRADNNAIRNKLPDSLE